MDEKEIISRFTQGLFYPIIFLSLFSFVKRFNQSTIYCLYNWSQYLVHFTDSGHGTFYTKLVVKCKVWTVTAGWLLPSSLHAMFYIIYCAYNVCKQLIVQKIKLKKKVHFIFAERSTCTPDSPKPCVYFHQMNQSGVKWDANSGVSV